MAGRIVVGIDGSPHSAGALEWAAARAAMGGEELELVNAYTAPPDVSFYGFQSRASTGPVEWYADHSRALLDEAAARVHAVAPGVPCTLRSDYGPAAALIAAAAEGADAVVVGRRGLGAVQSALLGSVSNRLAVEAPCPLIVVGEEHVPAAGPVVVGVDGSQFSAAAVRFAVSEAALRGTSVRAVTAYPPPVETRLADPELTARVHAAVEAEAAEDAARALAGLLPASGPSVEVEQVSVEGRPAEAILAHAGDAQLIVIGSHGKGLVRRVLLGSVSREVLHDADRPVALVDTRPASR